MHSFILISKNQKKIEAYFQTYCAEHGINAFDVHHFNPIENSFGIEEVRNLQIPAYLSPAKSKEKLLILDQAEKLTTQAQNALLKLLEEPPNNTFIFLVGTSVHFFLPTILSRCKIITTPEKDKSFTENDTIQYTSILDALSSTSIAEKLALAEKIAGSKEELTPLLTNLTLFLREKMLADANNTTYPKLINNLQDAFQLIQTTNVSPRVILEHTFLII